MDPHVEQSVSRGFWFVKIRFERLSGGTRPDSTDSTNAPAGNELTQYRVSIIGTAIKPPLFQLLHLKHATERGRLGGKMRGGGGGRRGGRRGRTGREKGRARGR